MGNTAARLPLALQDTPGCPRGCLQPQGRVRAVLPPRVFLARQEEKPWATASLHHREGLRSPSAVPHNASATQCHAGRRAGPRALPRAPVPHPQAPTRPWWHRRLSPASLRAGLGTRQADSTVCHGKRCCEGEEGIVAARGGSTGANPGPGARAALARGTAGAGARGRTAGGRLGEGSRKSKQQMCRAARPGEGGRGRLGPQAEPQPALVGPEP